MVNRYVDFVSDVHFKKCVNWVCEAYLDPSLKLDKKAFQSCISSGRFNKAIAQDVTDANNAGITGTPGFVIGATTDNKVKGTLISGTRPFSVFKAEIDKLLK